ncbi:MAG: chorismate synthase [Candidatus Hydrogenedentota bacterium]|nr:MAG: chorismate synthase [Candidatus Hydrogenedentota bacterium]
MRPFADIILDTTSESPETLAQQACELISQELAIRSRSANTYGDIIRLTTYGESHGKAIGGIMDGLRPGLPIDEDAIRVQMQRRRPGQSKVVTQRKEADDVEILSGVFEGKTTGAPIGFIIKNTDQRSKNYDDIKDKFRPGHADYTFYRKYGLRDYRGGGRSSARETAVRVGAGAIAMELLKSKGVTFRAHAVEVGTIKAETCDYDVIETNPVRCADPIAAKKMEEAILQIRKDQDSLGGIVQLDILGVPVGLGDPVFAKLDARLTHAIMTIGAIKGVEIGDGFAMTRMHGSETNDNMTDGDFLSNHAGGITGGISTGQTITLRIALKPTASISKEQQTIDTKGDNVSVEVHGRHDPCLVPRAVPVIENMAALVILDAWEIQTRLNPDWEKI